MNLDNINKGTILNNYDLIIIGGGAAGSFAACIAAETNPALKILIIEKNRSLMRKLGITGKGRCNLTNNSDIETCLKNIPVNGKFMYSAFNAFSPQETMDYFEKLGVGLKTERGNRVFPQSDKAADIVNALKNRIRELGIVTVHDQVKSVIVEDNGVKKVTGVRCENNSYYADNVILATGGLSYSKTGSTGDGYRIATDLGHTVTTLKPSLVPVETVEETASLMGLSLKNVTLSLFDSKSKKAERPVYSELGEMLFTHFGISGPLVLSASSYIRSDEVEHYWERYRFSIDLKPALSVEKLDARLLRDFAERKNMKLQNSLRAMLPEKLIPVFIERTGINPEKQVNEITRAERQAIINVLKSFDFRVKSLRPIEEAIITDGGVSVKEINPADMQSRLIKGLYFAGEIIDVTGFTGGFNLQIAFSSAWVSAKNIADKWKVDN